MTESNQGTAEMQKIKDAIIQLGAIIHAHAPRLSRLELAMQQLNTTVQGLCARPPPDPPTSDPSSGAGPRAHAAPAPLLSYVFSNSFPISPLWLTGLSISWWAPWTNNRIM